SRGRARIRRHEPERRRSAARRAPGRAGDPPPGPARLPLPLGRRAGLRLGHAAPARRRPAAGRRPARRPGAAGRAGRARTVRPARVHGSTSMNVILWIVVPYVAITVFLLGHIWRYRYDKFGWTTRS